VARPSKLEMCLMIVTSLTGLAAAIWMEMSPAERQLAIASARSMAYRMLHRGARMAGRQGIADEVNGWPGAARVQYGIAYRLARWRDKV
jgi:hypothetical protein